MTEWVKCTKSSGETVYVNLAIASHFYGHGSGSRIIFPSGEDDYVDVAESPERLLQLLDEAKRAART